MLFSVEQAFVGRDEIRAPLKTPASTAQHFSLPCGISQRDWRRKGRTKEEKGRLPRMLFSIIDLCYKISDCSLRSRLL